MNGVKPLCEEAKTIIRIAETVTVQQAESVTHNQVVLGRNCVPTYFALKLLQEVGELRNKVEPQNGDHAQIVQELERLRIRAQTQADELADRHDYAAEFPQHEADMLLQAIAILTMPKPSEATTFVYECILRAINDINADGGLARLEAYGEGWLHSWANALRNAGVTTHSRSADIEHALELLGEPQPQPRARSVEIKP
jgi:hypothetical protein